MNSEFELRTRTEMREAIERRTVARAANIAALSERFPAVFNKANPLPLAIGSDKAVRGALGASWSQGENLMRWWTHRRAYLAALSAGGPRYNIDGSENGEITPSQQAHAADQLRLLNKRL